MGNFSTKIFEIEEEARLFILATIPKGETKELISKEDLEDFSDEVYDLPFCQIVDKYDSYTQYAIISVKHTNEGGLIFNGYATTEDFGKRRDFNTSEIACGFLAEIADLLK